MNRVILTFVLILWCSVDVMAQRDAPVWSSYLPRIALFDERTSLDFEVTFNRCGGPVEQSSTQMYVLAYLDKDEKQILEIAANEKYVKKPKKPATPNEATDNENLLIDHLVKEKLAIVLETKVAKSMEKPPTISTTTGRAVRGGRCSDFAFSFDNATLFRSVGKLKNFDSLAFVDSDNRYYNDKFKLMIFVPVNDCVYATLIPKEQRDFYDFAHFMDSETIVQYFKPLPYRFQFKPLRSEDAVLIYID